MKNGILKTLASILIASTMAVSFTGCSNNTNKSTTQNNSSRDRVSRKPQVSMENNLYPDQPIYQDGEIISLADGSKIKYKKDGNHELLEKGSGKVIIFKKIVSSELDELTDEQKAIVRRQMQSDPNGFTLLY